MQINPMEIFTSLLPLRSFPFLLRLHSRSGCVVLAIAPHCHIEHNHPGLISLLH
jgi:hypothetical protein